MIQSEGFYEALYRTDEEIRNKFKAYALWVDRENQDVLLLTKKGR